MLYHKLCYVDEKIFSDFWFIKAWINQILDVNDSLSMIIIKIHGVSVYIFQCLSNEDENKNN